MNSTVSDDLTRENSASEISKCIKDLSANNRNLSLLHKELLEINLSVKTYVQESKKRLQGLRLDLAHEARSSHQVVELLTEK